VILAVPGWFVATLALRAPVDATVKMDVLLLVHTTDRSRVLPAASVTAALTLNVSFVNGVDVLDVISIRATAIGAVGAVPSRAQARLARATTDKLTRNPCPIR